MNIAIEVLGAILAITAASIAGWLYSSVLKSKPPKALISSKKSDEDSENHSSKIGLKKKIRLLVVDDESVVLDGLVSILSFSPDFEVVGQATNGLQAIDLAKKFQPDVVLLDMIMPEMDGLAALPRIKEISPSSKILILSSFAESERVYQAIKEGAMGYLLKDITRKQLLQAIRDAASGQASINPEIAISVLQQISQPSDVIYSAKPLTRRELETLRLLANGLSNEEIASTLVINERTVAKYISNILDKLHLANRTQAALYAIREGIAESKTKS